MGVDVDGDSELIGLLLEESGNFDVLSFFNGLVGFLGGGCFRKFLSNRDASHISSSIADSILVVMSGTLVMYSGMIRWFTLEIRVSTSCSSLW